MGCSHSTSTTEQVMENTPAVEAPTSESVNVATTEAPPASEEIKQEPPTSVPVKVAEEKKPEEEEAPVEEQPVEPAPEETPAPVEEPAEPAEEAPAPVEETAAPVEEAVEELAAPVEEAPTEEAPVDETTPEEAAVEEAAPEEATVEEEPAVKETEAEEPVAPEQEVSAAIEEPAVEEPAPVEDETLAEAQPEAPAEEPKAEATPEFDEKPATGSLYFTAEDVSFDKAGVAFYNFVGTDSEDPAKEIHVSKRFSAFKALHAQLTTLLADNQEDKHELPPLPKASAFKRRNNQKMLDERKAQFTVLLNAIANHPVASKSDAFSSFLA